MAIPELNEEGLLPKGIHDCTVDEIGERFAGFGQSAQRKRLFRQLKEYLAEALGREEIVEILVNGSFVTDKAEPGDVDLIVGTRRNRTVTMLAPVDYNLISNRRVKRRFDFDILSAPAGTPAFEQYVSEFKRAKGRPGKEKGILRVKR